MEAKRCMAERSTGNDSLVIDPRQALAAESSASVPADLFPLPLTPFEQYLLLDDLPDQPMTAFVQLTFANALDPLRLENALFHAVHRNPLLACRIRTNSRIWHWDMIAISSSLGTVPDQPPAVAGRIVPMDLRSRPGMRVWFHPTTKTAGGCCFSSTTHAPMALNAALRTGRSGSLCQRQRVCE